MLCYVVSKCRSIGTPELDKSVTGRLEWRLVTESSCSSSSGGAISGSKRLEAREGK